MGGGSAVQDTETPRRAYASPGCLFLNQARVAVRTTGNDVPGAALRTCGYTALSFLASAPLAASELRGLSQSIHGYTTYRIFLKQPSTTVTKSDIIERIATGTGMTRIETEAVINGFISCVSEALESGEGIELRGFGTFHVKYRQPRKARNPRTNEEVPVAARYMPMFRPSRSLRSRVDTAVRLSQGSEMGRSHG